MSQPAANMDNNNSGSLVNSPGITSLKNKSNTEHNRRIFSVDDDPEEVKHDIRYLEGLHDGLKYALRSKKSVSLHPFKSAPTVEDKPDNGANGRRQNISSTKNRVNSNDVIENHIDSALDDSANSRKPSLPNLMAAASTSHIPTETSLRRPRPVEHRSLSKIALLTTPESGIGFDFNSNNKNNLLDSDTRLNNDLVSDGSHIDTVPSPQMSQQEIDNAIISLHDISSENYVIHDSSVNNDIRIEQKPLAHNITNHNLNVPIINKNGQDLDNNNVDLEDCISTTSSLESFTLRERQDAINKTHPFGIRIWKPALYKKKRSVQRAAVDDIHETKLKKISWFVHLGNLIWSLSMGSIFAIIFTLSGIIVCVMGGFTQSARDYSLVFFQLAKYLFWPFGKVVYLLQDEHYLEEDRDEGISTQQFYKWVTSYSNKLFFHQSQSFSTDNNNEQHQPVHFTSYGSINGFAQPKHEVNNTKIMKSNNNIRTNRFENTLQDISRNSSNTPSMSGMNNGPLASATLLSMNESDNSQRRYFGRGQWSIGRILFYLLFHLFIEPTVLLASLITWLFVFTIPMSNILWNLLHHCRKHPLALGFKNISNTSSPETNPMNMHADRNILLCTFRCAGWHYYKFTMDGTNVIVMNLIFLVFFTIFDYFVLSTYFGLDYWFTNEEIIFVLCLASIVPLAFYIGQAVASISAQTSMGVGAVVNAFFSTIVEIFLYCAALEKREGPLVEGSLIGSILGAVLLLPGLSMCGGALNRKTQRYNPASAGVSSALLIFSMLVLLVPTVLNEIYGGYTVKCDDDNDSHQVLTLTVVSAFQAITQSKCYFVHPPLTYDKFFTTVIQPMSLCSAVVLFIAYAIGLWFTLRTHAKMIWELPIQNNERIGSIEAANDNASTNKHEIQTDSGHEAPNWSRTKSTWVLLIATLLYAIIAEILVDCVSSVLEAYPSVSPKILGLTIFALVPNTTEFLNAISFAIHGNVALSMEIGTAYALQVCQLQIPALVVFSVVYTWKMTDVNISEQMFTLVFPKWDIIAFIASIFMFTYLYAEGKSNYFKGSILILMYIIIILGFYFQSLLVDI